MDYETGDVSEERLREGFQHLVDNGHAWSLQGSYGRAAVEMLQSGFIKATTPQAKHYKNTR